MVLKEADWMQVSSFALFVLFTRGRETPWINPTFTMRTSCGDT